MAGRKGPAPPWKRRCVGLIDGRKRCPNKVRPGPSDIHARHWPKFQKCADCKRRDANRRGAQLRARRRAAGLCERCGMPREPELTGARCEFCKQQNREARAARVEASRDSGLCIEDGCNNPAVEGSVRCVPHLEKFRHRSRRQRKKGKAA